MRTVTIRSSDFLGFCAAKDNPFFRKNDISAERKQAKKNAEYRFHATKKYKNGHYLSDCDIQLNGKPSDILWWLEHIFSAPVRVLSASRVEVGSLTLEYELTERKPSSTQTIKDIFDL